MVLATLEAEADGLLEPRGLRAAWATQGDSVSNKQKSKNVGAFKGLGVCGLVVEHLPGIHKTPGLIPRTTKIIKMKNQVGCVRSTDPLV